jgi:phosphatidylinositol-3-phosphatase
VAPGCPGGADVRARLAVFVLAAAAILAACASASPAAPGPRAVVTVPAKAKPPHVKHVFTIVLENEDASTTFGPNSQAPYLSKTLRAKGAFLPNYYGIGHNSLDNYIAMISGQAPNPQTQADCQIFSDFTPGTQAADGQFLGTGCVYPLGAQTVANQLEDSGYTWKGYMQDMKASCRHPGIGQPDPTQSAHVGDQYAARHNPFVYFHSIIDSPTCAKNDVDLKKLSGNLKRERKTPSYAFITPNLCFDGHDSPCVDGKPGGLVSANVFLRTWVPKIMRSPAYRDRGLIIITFDEAEAGSDSSACCNEKPGPNVVPPDTPGGLNPGPGGGKVGAVLLSRCIKPGTVNNTPYNHYSMLRSIEDNFGLPHLGYAGQAGLAPFGRKTLNRPTCR